MQKLVQACSLIKSNQDNESINQLTEPGRMIKATFSYQLYCTLIHTDTRTCWNQEAQLSQSDRATHYRPISWNLVTCCTYVRKMTSGKAFRRWMTLKVTEGHPNCRCLIGQWSVVITAPSYAVSKILSHLECKWMLWPWEVLNFRNNSWNYKSRTLSDLCVNML